jgi:hypothetical protein
MRRLGLIIAVAAAGAVTAVGFTAGGTDTLRPLPLKGGAVPSPLLAVASTAQGSKLDQIDPLTFAPIRSSKPVDWYDGWVLSPDQALLAVAVSADGGYPTSTIRFANASTLTWVRKGVRLDGYFRGALWPRPDVLYALVGDCSCGPDLTLETINTATKKVVAKTPLKVQSATVTRSTAGLVLLGSPANMLAPARLSVIDPNGGVRSTTLDRIIAGTHFDQTSQDPVGTTRQPGLAVDDTDGVAYVIDPGGLIAEVRLSDLTVSYHQLGKSLIARLSAWLTPPAQAKGLNGPALTAQWLGDGLIAVAGTTSSTTKTKDGGINFSTSATGLRIIDTHNWSEHTLDQHTEQALVSDGLLLASGGYWRSATNSSGALASGEGLVAYAPDGSVRWQIDAGKHISLLGAWGSRALIQAFSSDATVQPVQLIGLDNGRVIHSFDPNSYPWPLTGTGS